MRPGQLALSAFHFFFLFFLFSAGIFCLLLEYKSGFKSIIYQWYEQSSLSFASIGILCLCFAFCVLLLLKRLYQRQYLSFKRQYGIASVDTQLIHRLIETWWQEKFSSQATILEVFLHSKKRLEIVATLPEHVSFYSSEFKDLELSLSRMLSKQLGYKRSFYVHVVLKQ